MKASLKVDLERRARELRGRLEDEEATRGDLRQAGRQALDMADSILQVRSRHTPPATCVCGPECR